ncbi:MAG TPA: hypothetical protein PL065_24960, partial [Polyangiaceae bacterium]|nr:hypothetical protein [Polyangiaceae bacterium]
AHLVVVAIILFGFVVAGVGAISTGVLYYLRTEPEDSAASTSSAVRSTTILPLISSDYQGLSIGGTF